MYIYSIYTYINSKKVETDLEFYLKTLKTEFPVAHCDLYQSVIKRLEVSYLYNIMSCITIVLYDNGTYTLIV